MERPPVSAVIGGQSHVVRFRFANEEITMKPALLALCLAAVALGACRREEAAPVYEPMKLGGAAQHDVQR